MTTTMNPNSTKIDFAAAELFPRLLEDGLAKGQRVTLKDLAAQYGMKSDDVRRALVAHFGARVMFVRGRNGGIRLA